MEHGTAIPTILATTLLVGGVVFCGIAMLVHKWRQRRSGPKQSHKPHGMSQGLDQGAIARSVAEGSSQNTFHS